MASSDIVRIYNAATGNTSYCTQLGFDTVWAAKGWVIVPADPTDPMPPDVFPLELIQDAVAAMVRADVGVSWAYDDVNGTLTLSVSGAGGGGGSTDPEVVRDTIGTALRGSGLITVTVDDPGDKITIGTSATANSSDTFLRDRANHTGTQVATTISDLTESVQDIVAALVRGGTGVTWTYDDAAGTLTLNATGTTGGGGGGGTTLTNSPAVLASNTAAQNTAVLTAWRTANAGVETKAQIVVPGVYDFDGDMDFSTQAKLDVEIGVGVSMRQARTGTGQTVTAYGFSASGAMVGSKLLLTADAKAGTDQLTLSSVTGLVATDATTGASGSRIWLVTSDTDSWLFNAKYNPTHLREVVAISGNTITLDTPLYRDFTVAAVAWCVKVNLHPPIRVRGWGKFTQLNPAAQGTFYNHLARFELCEGVVWDGPELTGGGGVGIEFASCWGVQMDNTTIHHLLDTNPNNSHLGYGVMVSGATRDWQIDVITHHLRHGFTTNAWTAPRKDPSNTFGINAASPGDPELGYIRISSYACVSQDVDTHEAGHSFTIECVAGGGNTLGVSGGNMAINCRSEDVIIKGQGAGGGQLRQSNAILQVDFSNNKNDTAHCTVKDFYGYGGDFGAILWTGTGTIHFENVHFQNVGTGIRVASGTGRVSGRRFIVDNRKLTGVAGVGIAFLNAFTGTCRFTEVEHYNVANKQTIGTPGLASNTYMMLGESMNTYWDGTGTAPTRPVMPAGLWTMRYGGSTVPTSVTSQLLTGDELHSDVA